MALHTAYDYDDLKLVNEFMDVSARAGFSNSGLVIDISASDKLAEAHYLRGVLLARLEGKKPPFKRGDTLKLKSNFTIPVFPQLCGQKRPTDLLTVSRTFYQGSDNWELAFVEQTKETTYEDCDEDRSFRSPCRFKASDFEKVTTQQERLNLNPLKR